MVVAFMRPGLPVAVLEEHLNATSQQVFPPRTHGGPQGVLINLNQFTCQDDKARREGQVRSIPGKGLV